MSARKNRREAEQDTLNFDELLSDTENDLSRASAEEAESAPGRMRRALGAVGRFFAGIFAWLAKPFARFRKPKRPVSSFTNRDLVNEAVLGIGSRPSRLVITLLGTVLGIASLVVTIGMAQTASGQISKQFDALAATQVVIEPGSSKQGEKERATSRLPWDAVTRVENLVGVERAALFANVSIGSDTVSAVSVYDPAEAKKASPKVVAGTGELMAVVNGKLDTGRFFDAGHDARGDRVIVLGAKAAKKLGVNRVTGQPAVFIGDKAYTVIGILGKTEARPALLDAVIVPMGTARGDFSLGKPESLDIRIEIGAGPVVGKQAPIALDPNTPENFKVKAPATASDLQGSVQQDINVVFLALGVIALLAGGLGIANVTLLSVMERGGEIGLRRALGATKRQIAQQFMLESVVTGVLGGLIGAAVGVFTIVIISLVQGWTPVLALWVPFVGVAVGALVGLGAGTYPAMKAASIEPVNALRDSR